MTTKQNTLSDEEAENIITRVPDFRDRAALMSHYVILRHRMNQLQQDIDDAKKAPEAIVTWLLEEIVQNKTTVRANYARKLAAMISGGQWRAQPEEPQITVIPQVQEKLTRAKKEDIKISNRKWLAANEQDYRGQWVAVHRGSLLGSASLLADLQDSLGQLPAGCLLTKVSDGIESEYHAAFDF